VQHLKDKEMNTQEQTWRNVMTCRVNELEEMWRRVIDLQNEYKENPEELYMGLEKLKVNEITPTLLKGYEDEVDKR
jgi:hypothetical protein